MQDLNLKIVSLDINGYIVNLISKVKLLIFEKYRLIGLNPEPTGVATLNRRTVRIQNLVQSCYSIANRLKYPLGDRRICRESASASDPCLHYFAVVHPVPQGI